MKAYSLALFLLAGSGLLCACNSDEKPTSSKAQPENPAPVSASQVKPGEIRMAQSVTTYNAEGVIPPQCYTKHEGRYNPCQVCHQNYGFDDRPNAMEDGNLQQEYAFSDFGLTNRWQNLFEDRRDRINAISDDFIMDYINADNYSVLIKQLEAMDDWQGPIPKLHNLQQGAEAFDQDGIARDGSRWVAFNYKPLPSTFWPTNGSTDDVMIRLPEAFSKASCASLSYSRDVYLANLSLVEMAIKDLDTLTVPEIDENAVCADLNNDGVLSSVTEINRQLNYVGDADNIMLSDMLYPLGTEFLHTVRYIGINEHGETVIPPRMKEVRYMKKIKFLNQASLLSAYGNEHQEKIDENLPNYVYRQERGSANDFGWQLNGFIEAKEGHLRLQNKEETLFCMGCHSTIGTTIDQTFAFARKMDGAMGWGYIDYRGMPDSPTRGENTGEFLQYLEQVGGGDEFRQNTEMLARWFDTDGNVLADKVTDADIYTLITPSPERALALNKAYYTIVQDQDFIHGRDANLAPAVNVYQSVDDTTETLPDDKVQPFDLRLDW